MLSSNISGLSITGLYVCSNILVVVAAILLAGIRSVSGAMAKPLSFGHQLAMGRVLLVAALLLPAITIFGGGSHFSALRAQVWSAPSMRAPATTLRSAAQLEVGIASRHASVSVNLLESMAALAFAAGMLMTLLPLFKEVRSTYRAVRDAHPIRRIGRVRIRLSDREPVPFALWVPGRASIVLPAALLMRATDLRLALQHEAQHHRQGDTRFVYVLLFLRILFGLNPAAHWLARQVSDLQEYACDEHMTGRRGHSPSAYCACLLRIADAALSGREPLLRSPMACRRAGVLAKRIENALVRPGRALRWPAAASMGVLVLALLGIATAAIAGPIHDQRLSRAEAVHLAAGFQGPSIVPLKINSAVLRQLNLLLGTRTGREFLHSSIARMHRYAPGILPALKRAGLPADLLVIPLVESGFRNLRPHGGHGAGLWQMIGPTARRYGLVVSTDRDERLNIREETSAAIRMLSDLHDRLRSWSLAVMAYDAGLSRIEAGIRATQSRDAWTLYHAGFDSDRQYFPRVVAAILIMRNRGLLDRGSVK